MAEGAVEQAVGSPAPQERPISQQRFNEVYWQAKEAERRNQQLEQRLLELETKGTEAPTSAPTLEKFDYDETAYAQAREAYQLNLVREEARKTARDELERDKNFAKEMTKKQKQDEFLKRAGEYALSNPEYDEVTRRAGAAGVAINQAATNIIMESEKGPALHHYLLANPTVLEDLNAIQDPAMVGMKVGQIMMNMQTVRSTGAPPPINPGEGGAISKKSLYDEDISMEEFERIVNEG